MILIYFIQAIENELLERLQKGVYGPGDIVNYPLKEYINILDMEKLQPAEVEDEEVGFCRPFSLFLNQHAY